MSNYPIALAAPAPPRPRTLRRRGDVRCSDVPVPAPRSPPAARAGASGGPPALVGIRPGVQPDAGARLAGRNSPTSGWRWAVAFTVDAPTRGRRPGPRARRAGDAGASRRRSCGAAHAPRRPARRRRARVARCPPVRARARRRSNDGARVRRFIVHVRRPRDAGRVGSEQPEALGRPRPLLSTPPACAAGRARDAGGAWVVEIDDAGRPARAARDDRRGARGHARHPLRRAGAARAAARGVPSERHRTTSRATSGTSTTR